MAQHGRRRTPLECHLSDIEGILRIRGDAVDRDYISKHAGQLSVLAIWQAILDKID